ncbi:uncharacterized protein BDZ99DRAFT_521157 [Mytilinidion resinicola]|uniref:Uncharacterized protein n=1 Tax=Mytilinidion resinicola TaxID=574789 RepID=A0A6A6YMQ9_9PEZI|nr:uncharacterized protein BDZ99DRAFT_521157 [Mytilinidion resinicola]KAF2809839.1 hypothetical protein BDZ99DRAFT_521157 [Mytilinidion resinicola]
MAQAAFEIDLTESLYAVTLEDTAFDRAIAKCILSRHEFRQVCHKATDLQYLRKLEAKIWADGIQIAADYLSDLATNLNCVGLEHFELWLYTSKDLKNLRDLILLRNPARHLLPTIAEVAETARQCAPNLATFSILIRETPGVTARASFRRHRDDGEWVQVRYLKKREAFAKLFKAVKNEMVMSEQRLVHSGASTPKTTLKTENSNTAITNVSSQVPQGTRPVSASPAPTTSSRHLKILTEGASDSFDYMYQFRKCFSVNLEELTLEVRAVDSGPNYTAATSYHRSATGQADAEAITHRDQYHARWWRVELSYEYAYEDDEEDEEDEQDEEWTNNIPASQGAFGVIMLAVASALSGSQRKAKNIALHTPQAETQNHEGSPYAVFEVPCGTWNVVQMNSFL